MCVRARNVWWRVLLHQSVPGEVLAKLIEARPPYPSSSRYILFGIRGPRGSLGMDGCMGPISTKHLQPAKAKD